MAGQSRAEIDRGHLLNDMKKNDQNPFRSMLYMTHGSHKFTKEDIRKYYVLYKKSYDIVLG